MRHSGDFQAACPWSLRWCQLLGDAEIAEFEMVCLFEEDVGWLNVTVHDLVSVKKLDSPCKLVPVEPCARNTQHFKLHPTTLSHYFIIPLYRTSLSYYFITIDLDQLDNILLLLALYTLILQPI